MAAKRGARPNLPVDPVGPVLDGELLDERQKQVAVMNEHTREVIEQFGDGLPWSPEHYETQIRSELRRGCESFLRAGRYLIVARECAAYGEWQGMLSRLGIEPRQARRMMEAAKRVSALPNRSTSTDLIRAANTSSKLIELLSLPEDQFAELVTEGETGELSLEGVEKMTVHELRAAVRDARADIQAKDDRAAKRERDLEALQKQVRQLKGQRSRAGASETLLGLREYADMAALQTRMDISARGEDADSLYERFRALREYAIEQAGPDGAGDEFDQYMGGIIGELMSELRRLRDAFGLPIVADHGAPDWMEV